MKLISEFSGLLLWIIVDQLLHKWLSIYFEAINVAHEPSMCFRSFVQLIFILDFPSTKEQSSASWIVRTEGVQFYSWAIIQSYFSCYFFHY